MILRKISGFLMNKHQRKLVKYFNELLEEKTWSEFEIHNGRTITVHETWRSHIKEVVIAYRGAGWIISRHVELCSDSTGNPRDYLIFKHPLSSGFEN
jgi:hypothetical protein